MIGLSLLRDIHLPPTISFWPPTLGWYFVSFVLVVIFTGLIFWMYQIIKRYNKRRKIFKELQLLQKEYAMNPQQVIAAISILLRRISLAFFERNKVAGLIGENWLCFLDQVGHTHQFSKGIGRVLIDAPYARDSRPPSKDIVALIKLVQLWVKKVLKSHD